MCLHCAQSVSVSLGQPETDRQGEICLAGGEVNSMALLMPAAPLDSLLDPQAHTPMYAHTRLTSHLIAKSSNERKLF